MGIGGLGSGAAGLHPGAPTAKVPPRAPPALARARVLAGPPPAVGSGGGAALFGPARGPSSSTSPVPDAAMAIQAATLKLLTDLASKKKRGVPGLAEDEESDEGEVPSLPGSKGAAAAARLHASMKKHPKAFADRLEKNM
eukprot:6493006-Lingulodinium_polyedra.AAC.1